MKNIIKIAAVALVGLSFTSCDDFLNDNRYPLSTQTNSSVFWNSPDNVQNEINYFYNDFLGYGNGTGTGNFYFKWTTDDQCGRTSFAQWLNLNTSPSMSSWSASYTEIRRAYLIIKGVTESSLTDAQKANFLGQARMYLGRQYYDLVRKFGDVPLIDEALEPTDLEALYVPRTNRNEVMDFVLKNLDFAVENISATSSKTQFSKDMAQAMKAEICLYEGAYAKYHQKDNTRANKFFAEVVKAGEAISDKYPIVADYTSLYKSLQNAMNTNSEVIFSKQYVENVFMHSTMDYSCASDGIAGITRDAFDSFLLIDGTLPKYYKV